MKNPLHVQTSKPQSVFPKILLFTVVLFLPLLALAQWESANEPPGLLGIQLKVVNEDTIFCASEANGKIYRTTDGSENWDTFQTSVSDAEFLDFDFPTPEVGYAICQSSASSTPVLIFKTPDGGTTWDSLSLDAMDYIGPCNVHFLNADTGFVSNGNNILRTVDGTNFTSFELSSEPNEVVQALTATSDGVVFVSTEFVGGLPDEINRYSIYRSADVGETWTEVYSNVQQNVPVLNQYRINEIDFPTQDTGFAVGGNGRFLKTTDSGQTWTETIITPIDDLTSLSFTSAETGYINNQNGIYKTNDGGDTWTSQDYPGSAYIIGIQFASENVGYAFSITNIIKTINGGGIVGVAEHEVSDRLKVYPNPTRGILSVRSEDGRIKNVEVLDLTGNRVTGYTGNFESIDLSNIAAGTYFLKINTANAIRVRKLIVN